ncbi:MAG TPA: hypothetical protein VF516_12205 [Kofleriaceae bacterium]
MWKEDLHPRDEYGRFRDFIPGDRPGSMGTFDKLAGGLANRAHARTMEQHEALWQKQFNYYQPLQASGQLTPEIDAQWDRDIEMRDALRERLPEAGRRGLQPHDDGTWRYRDRPDVPFDEHGKRLPRSAVLGYVRVGDTGDEPAAGQSELFGGYWHKPGARLHAAGGLPELYDDNGRRLSNTTVRALAGLPVTPPTVQHRRYEGAMYRAEVQAGIRRELTRYQRVPFTLPSGERSVLFSGRRVERDSPEVTGANMISPLNPTSRRRTARGQRKRQQTVTWIQRVNQQIEGRMA